MNKRSTTRRMKCLMYKNIPHWHSYSSILNLIAQIEEEGVNYCPHRGIFEIKEVYEHGFKLGLTEAQVQQQWREQSIKRQDAHARMSLKPLGTRRDNRDVIIGRGGVHENCNPYRYPSKKRSKRTWRNFYTLFPHLAIRDNWDGTTSDKMK